MSEQEQLHNAYEMLKSAMLAEQRALTSQDYQIGTRRNRMAELRQIGDRIKFWQAEIDRLEGNSRIRVRQAIDRNT